MGAEGREGFDLGVWAASRALARVALLRASRGRSLAIALVVAILPAALAGVHAAFGRGGPDDTWSRALGLGLAVQAVIPPLLVAGAIGDDLDDRTVAYLWSRPLPRGALVTGVLLAMVPLTAALLALSLGGALLVIWGAAVEPARAGCVVAASALGALAGSAASAALATWSPRFGTALAVLYLLTVDVGVAQVPGALRTLSIHHHVVTLAEAADAAATTSTASALGAVGALVLIAAAWTALAMRRVGRVE